MCWNIYEIVIIVVLFYRDFVCGYYYCLLFREIDIVQRFVQFIIWFFEVLVYVDLYKCNWVWLNN